MLGGTAYSVGYAYISPMRMLPTSKSLAAWGGDILQSLQGKKFVIMGETETLR
jgi:hypothetical protein